MLTHEMADAIVKETMFRLNRNINIMDQNGVIIASGDPARIYQVHEGALEVIRNGKPLIISNKNQDYWKGSLAGINLPIEFQNKIVGVIGITGEPEKVEEFGGVVKMLTELMINQSFLASQAEWKQRTKEMIIEELIKPVPNFEAVDQRLNLLQVRLSPPFNVSVIEIKEWKLQNQVIIKQIEEILADNQCLVGFINVNRLFILTCGISEKKNIRKLQVIHDMLGRMGLQFILGYTGQVHSHKEISIAYQESDLALLIGEDGRQLVSYSDIETKALVHQMDDDVKERYMSRILPDISAKLIQTLQAFFSCNLNLTETAKTLYIHRNTLIYRLKIIKEKTGYDPQIFKDAVPLQLAVWIYQNRNKGPL